MDGQSSRIPPLGNFNICNKFHGNAWWDISIWNKVVKRATAPSNFQIHTWVRFSQNNILSRMTWWSKFPQMFLVIEGVKLSVSIEVIVWISSPCWYIWLEGAVCAASKKLLLLFLTAVVRVSKMIQLVKLQRQDKPDFSPLKSPDATSSN